MRAGFSVVLVDRQVVVVNKTEINRVKIIIGCLRNHRVVGPILSGRIRNDDGSINLLLVCRTSPLALIGLRGYVDALEERCLFISQMSSGFCTILQRETDKIFNIRFNRTEICADQFKINSTTVYYGVDD